MDGNMTKHILAVCSVFLAVGMLSTLALAEGAVYNMYIEPYVISLNANSASNANPETMASFGCYMKGAIITDSNVEFVIGEDVVATSNNARVTRMGSCQVYFDKYDIQGYALENGLTEEVVVTVRGTYTYEPIGGGDPSGPVKFTGEGVVFFR